MLRSGVLVVQVYGTVLLTTTVLFGSRYSIGHVVDTLVAFCAANDRDPKRTYIWICCLCVNQHRVVENRNSGKDIPPEQFFAEFGDRVTGIGNILAMMAPWNDPAYLVSKGTGV